MNRAFKRLPFPVKLVLIGLIPLAFLIYFALQILSEKNNRISIVNNVVNEINLSAATMELAEQVHLERRMSFSYLVNKISLAELVAQFSKTDNSLKAVHDLDRSAYDSYFRYSLLDQLKNTRKQILVRQLSADQLLDFYSSLLIRVHSISSASVDNIPYLASINKDLTGQKTMAQVLNYFGSLRAGVYFTALKTNPGAREFDDIQQNYSLTMSYWAEFLAKSSTASLQKFQQLSQSPEALYLNKVLPQIIAGRSLPQGFNGEKWWQQSEVLADKMRNMQADMILQTREAARDIQQNERQSLIWSMLILSGITLLVIYIIYYSIRSITGSLNELRAAAEKISAGETAIELQPGSKDAIGSLSKSISTIAFTNHELARAADAIGRGDFSVQVVPRSHKDTLGNAVHKMKDDLQQFSKESAEKIWIQSGLSLINDSTRGEKSIRDLCDDVLNALVGYLGAQVGLIYSHNSGHLDFAAGYALSANYAPPKHIALGETLIGQAAANMRLMFLEDVPDDFVRISSAAGDAPPRYLLIVPLLHNGLVQGVMEIGSFAGFPTSAIPLLEQGAASIAIAIQTANNRTKLQELFEETQAQSEELQAQHSEMENINAELEAQTQKLQASEEELRVQQEELQQANQELEERSRLLEEKNQLIIDRNSEIQRKAEELELSSKYKSEFLANMSHELRTPLNSILLLSRLMAENNDNNLSQDQVESARVIQSSGKGLLALIDEILDLSKIESGKMDLEYAEVTIADIASNMKALFAPIANDKKVEFVIETDNSLNGTISTDQLRLEQILKNLLSNALKFTTSGSVKFSIVPSAGNTGLIEFRVKDTGPGIPEDKQKLIFEAFQQADGSTKRKFGGTGLGLSISRELARLLGGDIQLTSTPGKGSEFRAVIPKSKPEAAIVAETEERVPLLPEKRSAGLSPQPARFLSPAIPADVPDDRNNITEGDRLVLIVEDDTSFAKALLDFTHNKGYKGIVSVRGDQATELALQYRPSAILLDIQLPVKDGWEVMEELKSNSQLRHIPVHIMSSMQAKKESLTKGAVDFISKPFAIEQMQDVFRKLEDALKSGPKKVLIVEENPKHAKALAYFLETFNISAEIKGSVHEGVSALKEDKIDCVILDMGIPDQNAYETLDTVKQNPGLENLPIIIFTGKNLSKAEENRIKQYADSIVVKTAHSYQRILDEISLFLHLIEDRIEPGKNGSMHKLGAMDDVLKDRTVLIADDDVRNIFSLTRSLEQHKMKVISAMDGKEALKQLEDNPDIDIVLMDMMMPEMDGYETTVRIKQQRRYKNLPVLAVTAKAMLGDREKCIKAGASDYISKPVDIDQLVSLLRVWLYDKSF